MGFSETLDPIEFVSKIDDNIKVLYLHGSDDTVCEVSHSELLVEVGYYLLYFISKLIFI